MPTNRHPAEMRLEKISCTPAEMPTQTSPRRPSWSKNMNEMMCTYLLDFFYTNSKTQRKLTVTGGKVRVSWCRIINVTFNFIFQWVHLYGKINWGRPQIVYYGLFVIMSTDDWYNTAHCHSVVLFCFNLKVYRGTERSAVFLAQLCFINYKII